MTPCNEFKAARMRHLAAIAALERREMEAEATHQWSKAKTIRESIAWLEHHNPGDLASCRGLTRSPSRPSGPSCPSKFA